MVTPTEVPMPVRVGQGWVWLLARPQHQASPHRMSMNIRGRERILVPTVPHRIPRPALPARRGELAVDLAVLLRRAATEPGSD